MRFISIFLFFLSFQVYGQNQIIQQKVDSVLYYLDNAKEENRVLYVQKAVRISSEIQNDTLLKKAAFRLGYRAYSAKDTLGLKVAEKTLIELFIKTNDSSCLAKKNHFRALVFRIQNHLDSSYYYYNKSKDISLELGEFREAGIRLKSMGEMQHAEKDYAGAEVTIIKALELLEPLDEITFIANCYSALGNSLTQLNQFKEARKYFLKSRETINRSSSESEKERWNLNLLNNVGYSYLVEKNYVKSLELLEEGLAFPNIKKNYKNQYKLLLESAASCKYYLGRTEEAWEDFNHLLKLREKEDDLRKRSRTHFNFAYYLAFEGKNKKALHHARKSYTLSKKANDNFITQMALEKLIQLTSSEESNKFVNEYIELRNWLEKRQVSLMNQHALVQYETEKKEKENVGLKLKTAQQESQLETEKQQKVISWLFSLAAILGLVLSFTFFRARRKKLMYEAQLSKASAREEERQQIAKSLHDEVAGDLRMLHQKLVRTDYREEANNLDKIKENVRNLSHQLSSVSFDEVSFKDQMINLVADNFSLDFRISVEGVDSVLWETVNSAIKRTLYLCVRESLQNTLKYAEASKFFISFSSEKKEILLHLKDNGKGFDLKKGKKGIGLKNLKERVEEIQGSFHIETSEQGTKTTISIPINGR